MSIVIQLPDIFIDHPCNRVVIKYDILLKNMFHKGIIFKDAFTLFHLIIIQLFCMPMKGFHTFNSMYFFSSYLLFIVYISPIIPWHAGV